MMIILLCLMGLITWISWRYLVRIYSRMQGALQEAFIEAPGEGHAPDRHAELAVVLNRAELERVEIPADAPSAGKLLSELQLRTRSGATVVAIERGEEAIVNPGPDEEMRPGDILLLIGARRQIDLAREQLCGPPAES